MKETGQILEEFWEMVESRCTLDLKNGNHLEGYILEIEGENLVFGEGGPFASEQEIVIPIEEINLDTLYFWSESKRCYIHAKLYAD